MDNFLYMYFYIILVATISLCLSFGIGLFIFKKKIVKEGVCENVDCQVSKDEIWGNQVPQQQEQHQQHQPQQHQQHQCQQYQQHQQYQHHQQHQQSQQPQQHQQPKLNSSTPNYKSLLRSIRDYVVEDEEQQPQPKTQPQPKPKHTASTPGYKLLLKKINDYVVEDEPQQQQQPQKRQPPHQLQKNTSQKIKDLLKALVNSFGKLSLQSPQLSEVEKAHKRLNKRLELYQLMERREIPGDGNCQMHALSDQLYGNLNHSRAIRNIIVTWLRKNRGFSLSNGATLSEFVTTTSWDEYCNNMSKNGTWGDHLTLVAAAEIFRINISIISSVETQSNFVTEITPSKKSDHALTLSFRNKLNKNTSRSLLCLSNSGKSA
ncbi:hypothetical protein DICPUDRAFT_149557 [Dictyostelium purpureum]|uniref:OTU domain-containing protein n=1 Tax=Dictyostelium purpureum TaxID=5786 RepID=F0ZE27_DICPU|nr:uncharacterized protein DICPUDRAFT_149557 [Dictyostelium purpureum]EGC37812.1 hypothetical protein DICPUDRAFT_149557 [Dictyostelium purpureum]|eukprot:XP_003285657.1 hypothetical protein DICPUDRAFT_149557 [Dictyostelium purpureum]